MTILKDMDNIQWMTTMWWMDSSWGKWHYHHNTIIPSITSFVCYHVVLLGFSWNSLSTNHPLPAVQQLIMIIHRVNSTINQLTFPSCRCYSPSPPTRCPQAHLEAFLQTRRTRRPRHHIFHWTSWDSCCRGWYRQRQSSSSFGDCQWCCTQHQENPFSSQVRITTITNILSCPVVNVLLTHFSSFVFSFFLFYADNWRRKTRKLTLATMVFLPDALLLLPSL